MKSISYQTNASAMLIALVAGASGCSSEDMTNEENFTDSVTVTDSDQPVFICQNGRVKLGSRNSSSLITADFEYTDGGPGENIFTPSSAQSRNNANINALVLTDGSNGTLYCNSSRSGVPNLRLIQESHGGIRLLWAGRGNTRQTKSLCVYSGTDVRPCSSGNRYILRINMNKEDRSLIERQYGLMDVANRYQPSNTSPRIAMFNALFNVINYITPSESETREVFGNNIDMDKVEDFKSDAYRAAVGDPNGINSVEAWMPRYRLFDPGQSTIRDFNGADRFASAGQNRQPPLNGAYRNSVIYISEDLFGAGADEDIAECVMTQELAHHLDHRFKNGVNDAGAEGIIAALKLCDHDYQLTDAQMLALQERQDRADLRLRLYDEMRESYRTYNYDGAELGFWKTLGGAAGLVLVAVLAPEAAPFLIGAEIAEAGVVAEGVALAVEGEEAIAVVAEGEEALGVVEAVEEADVDIAELTEEFEEACGL